MDVFGAWGGGGGGGFKEGGVILDSVFFDTVKIRGYLLQVDVQDFSCVSLCVVSLHMLDCRCLSVHLVLLGPCMYCYVVLHIVSRHCSFVFTLSLLKCFSGFSNVDTVIFDTWYLVYTTPFFFHSGLGSFICTKASLRVSFNLKVVLMPRLLHLLSILSLTPLTYGKLRNLGTVLLFLSLGEKGWSRCWVVPESRVHHQCLISICLKDLPRWFFTPINLETVAKNVCYAMF